MRLGGEFVVDDLLVDPEPVASTAAPARPRRKRHVGRWVVLGLLAFVAWRAFLVIDPSQSLAVLRYTIMARADYSQPYEPALVVWNGSQLGGPIGSLAGGLEVAHGYAEPMAHNMAGNAVDGFDWALRRAVDQRLYKLQHMRYWVANVPGVTPNKERYVYVQAEEMSPVSLGPWPGHAFPQAPGMHPVTAAELNAGSAPGSMDYPKGEALGTLRYTVVNDGHGWLVNQTVATQDSEVPIINGKVWHA